MTQRYFPALAILIASGAGLFTACSDAGYQGPLLPGSGGSASNNTSGTTGTGQSGSTGTAGTAVTPTGGMSGSATTGGSAGSAPTGGGEGGSSVATGGMSGSATTGGSGGSGGSVAMAVSPIPMDMLQHKWRYTHTCKFLGGQPVSNFPTCSEGNNDICTETADNARWYDMNPPVWKFGGDPSKTYEIKIRLRAISEPKTYNNCPEVNARTDGGKHPMICDGTGKNVLKPGENFNVLNFRITEPRQDFYMNMAEIDEPHRVEKLDEVFTIKAKGGTTATFLFDDLNGGEIRNCPKYTFNGMPDVAPYDNTAIDGEFWQWDCADTAGGDACWKEVP